MAKIQDIRNRTRRTNGTRNLSQIKNIVRHHSATDSGNFDTFWRYWNRTLGWGTGGYAEIILRDGTVQLCYDANEITNGVANHNTTSYHICLVGNGSFTDAQEKAWDERVAYNMDRLNISVNNVKGHKEMPGASTSCPGIDMDKVRSRIKGGEKQESAPARKTKSNTSNGANLTVDGYWGRNTTEALQNALGTVADGEIWGQYNTATTRQITSGMVYGPPHNGSPVIVELQKKVGGKRDGLLGPDTVKRTQKYLGTPVDGIISTPSTMVKELQRHLNAGTF